MEERRAATTTASERRKRAAAASLPRPLFASDAVAFFLVLLPPLPPPLLLLTLRFAAPTTALGRGVLAAEASKDETWKEERERGSGQAERVNKKKERFPRAKSLSITHSFRCSKKRRIGNKRSQHAYHARAPRGLLGRRRGRRRGRARRRTVAAAAATSTGGDQALLELVALAVAVLVRLMIFFSW